MKKFCTIIIILSVLIAGTTYAVNKSRKQVLAEELLNLMDTKKKIEDTFNMVKKVALSQLQKEQTGNEEAKKAEEILEEIMDIFTKELC